MRKKLKTEKGMTGEEFRELVDKEIDELIEIKKKINDHERRLKILETHVGFIWLKDDDIFEDYEGSSTTLS